MKAINKLHALSLENVHVGNHGPGGWAYPGGDLEAVTARYE